MKKSTAFILIIISGIAWGTSGIFVKLLAPYGLSSLQILSLRAVSAALIMSVYGIVKDRSLFKIKGKRHIMLQLVGGVALFGTAACYFVSMQMTSIATAVVLMYMAPVLVMIYSVAFLGERFSLPKGISVFLMLVGCGLVSGVVGGLKFDPVGIAVGAMSGICYAAYNIITKIQMQAKMRPTSVSIYNFIIVSVISLAVSAPVGTLKAFASDTLQVSLLAIGIGVVTFILPYILYTLAIRELPAGTSSALAIVEPMSATLFGLVFFSESLTVPSGIGILLILSAVLILSRASEEKATNK